MLLPSLKAASLADILDIAFVAVLVYALLAWFKRARAAFVAIGMLVFASIYFLARAIGMLMTTWIFHGFFAALIVVLIVIFQEELRSLFERIAIWSLQAAPAQAPPQESEILVSTLGELARDHIGALIVVRGHDPLDRHVEGGWNLNGDLSDALLKSIFDSHSLGHDGAVLIENGRVSRFGCQLPLSRAFEKTTNMGTRHKAALGLSELSDALCLAVSQEHGTISVAREGEIQVVRELQDLQDHIENFMTEMAPPPPKNRILNFFKHNLREKAIAFATSALLWALFVFGSKPWRQIYAVPVAVRNVPADLQVARVRPDEVRVTLTGLMRDFYWLDSRQIVLRLDLSQAEVGVNRVKITDRDMGHPAGFDVEEADPESVEVDLSPRGHLGSGR